LKDNAWFKRWFNTQEYLDLYKHRDTIEAQKIIELLLSRIYLPKGSRILDLACGNGRHSILFAKKGYNVTGIDLSRFLINQAKNMLKDEYLRHSSRLKFEIRDMRNIDHINEFDLTINVFTSFGYFENDADNEKVINGISGTLKKGGYFLLDFLNPGHLVKSLVPFNIKKYNSKVIVQIRNIRGRFVYKDILIFRNNNSIGTLAYDHYRERIRLYSLPDFEQMFSKNSLKILQTFGNYEGNKFSINNSARLILLAQKI
jgi:SAM-dependent methyltransferase